MIQIGGLQKLTLIDYQGKLACSVFLIGCSFRCPWCYNRELVLPEEKAKSEISEKEFFNFLKEKKRFLEGTVISGGEPTINPELVEFCQKIKKIGYSIKVDTNGSNPEILEKLIEKKLIDYVAMDIKAPFKNQKSKCNHNPFSMGWVVQPRSFEKGRGWDKKQNENVKFKENKYNKATGVNVDLNMIKKSIEIIKNSGIDYEFRTTVVPNIHTKEDILEIAKEISPAKRYFLQKFWPKKTLDPKFEKIKPYSQEFLLEIQKVISPFFEICQVR